MSLRDLKVELLSGVGGVSSALSAKCQLDSKVTENRKQFYCPEWIIWLSDRNQLKNISALNPIRLLMKFGFNQHRVVEKKPFENNGWTITEM